MEPLWSGFGAHTVNRSATNLLGLQALYLPYCYCHFLPALSVFLSYLSPPLLSTMLAKQWRVEEQVTQFSDVPESQDSVTGNCTS